MSKALVIEQWLEVEESMIIDIPPGKRTPVRGKPWTYYLFAWDVEKRQLKSGVKEFAKRRVITVTGRTKKEADDNARQIVESARLVPEGSRR